MASLAEIQSLVQRIHDDLPLLVQRSQIAPQQIVVGEGLADISRRLGLIQAGEFRAGNGKEPGSGFTGGRYGYPGFLYGSETYFLAGVEDDVLQVGLSITDGKIYAGQGTVQIFTGGITIDNDQVGLSFRATDASLSMFLKSTTDDDLWIVNSVPSKQVHIVSYLADATTPGVIWGEDSSNANVAKLMINMGFESPTVVSIGGAGGVGNTGVTIWANKDGKETVFNDTSFDIDHRFEGATDANLLKIDAGLDAIGMGGSAESGFKLKVTGNVSLDGAVTINASTADKDFIVKDDAGTSQLHVDAGDGQTRINTIKVVSLVNDTGLASGTYAPTVTAGTNMDSASAVANFAYLRVGNVVIVSGNLNADATTAGVQSKVRISLPVSSNFTSTGDLTGTGGIQGSDDVVIVIADTVNDEAEVNYTPAGAAASVIRLLFMFPVL